VSAPRRERRARGVALAAASLAALAFLAALLQPLAGSGHGNVRVVVPRGSSAGDIADILDRAGVVESAWLFDLRALLDGKRADLKPGVYYLRKGMAYGDVLDRLSSGSAGEIVQLTIPEGLSRAEIAPLAGRAGVRGSYRDASDLRRYGTPAGAARLEGFLFPATYDLKRGSSAATLVAKQLAAFRANFAGVDLSYAHSKNLTAFDVLTIASMVEREAQVARERPLVAAVIYNRLHAHQPLGIDATVRYATGNWSSPLTRSQLALDSPYNTRLRAGLPPGPIGNPGLAAIKAAAQPARVGYLYYVIKPGTCGEHSFSTTFAAFERDRARYDAARAAAGGRSPTKCP
jgi:uncharacterized YceG family protein